MKKRRKKPTCTHWNGNDYSHIIGRCESRLNTVTNRLNGTARIMFSFDGNIQLYYYMHIWDPCQIETSKFSEKNHHHHRAETKKQNQNGMLRTHLLYIHKSLSHACYYYYFYLNDFLLVFVVLCVLTRIHSFPLVLPFFFFVFAARANK